MQLDFFKIILPQASTRMLASRWKGDGPYPAKLSPCSRFDSPIVIFFDGTGTCHMQCYACDCGVLHPVDYRWGSHEGVRRDCHS